ncbi:MAG: hypothetical protein JW940_02690 [Polyangiaceae bacterium]|nr:hypothetical protein [Polyangiaceae bacterium]
MTDATIGFVDFCESVLGITFERGQRVFWSVAADRVPFSSLSTDDLEVAREMFGDIGDIGIPESAWRHVCVVKGADVGFSYLGGLRLLHRALTATELGAPGEVRPALVVAPDLRLGRIPVRNALGAAQSVPAIARMIESSTSDGFVLAREGGRKTSVECLPATAGGRALRGRRYLEVLFDEAAFFRDSDYAVNDVDCRRAVTSRCLGTFWNGSTPWLESADVWKTFEHNFAHPSTALAARLPTLLVRTDRRVVELVEAERERDPEGAATEYDCVPPAGSGGYYFDPTAVNACADPDMLAELDPDPNGTAVAGLDPAFQRDASAGVVIRINGDDFEVASVYERRPQRGKPLVPSEVTAEFAALAKSHGARELVSDIHYQVQVAADAADADMSFTPAPGGHAGKAQMFADAKELIHAGRIRWSSQHSRLTRQLRDVIGKPGAAGSLMITSPRRKGAHGDLASAFVAALWLAKQRTGGCRIELDPNWVDDSFWAGCPGPGF